MIIHRVEQRTDAWFKLRAGIPCTSGFQNIITPKGARTSGERRRKYMMRLLAERLWGRSMDDRFENYWTVRGKELEPAAAEAFVQRFGQSLTDGVFITNFSDRVGCSPDRLIGRIVDSETGECLEWDIRECLEMKCTAPWTHVDYLLNGAGVDYRQQVQGQLWVGEFERNHFWAWHPQAPPVWICTERDEPFIEALAQEVLLFCDELDAAEREARSLGEFTPGPEEPLVTPGVFPWREGDTLQ